MSPFFPFSNGARKPTNMPLLFLSLDNGKKNFLRIERKIKSRIIPGRLRSAPKRSVCGTDGCCFEADDDDDRGDGDDDVVDDGRCEDEEEAAIPCFLDEECHVLFPPEACTETENVLESGRNIFYCSSSFFVCRKGEKR